MRDPWLQHTSRLYDSMKNRPAIIKRGGVQSFFSLDRFRIWMAEHIRMRGGQHKGAGGWRCHYFDGCGQMIRLETASVDHYEPLSEGGNVGTDNLVLCCKVCNSGKGEMPAEWWLAFRKALNAMPDRWRKYILNAICAGSVQRMLHFQRVRPGKGKKDGTRDGGEVAKGVRRKSGKGGTGAGGSKAGGQGELGW